MLEVKGKFIEPHFVSEVGMIGLTCVDIARALEIDLRDLHKKIKRDTWTKDESWKPISYIVNKNIKSGAYVPMKRESYFFFSIQGAKAFVAKYNNNVGDSYLKFLFDCEEAALHKIPQLQNIINQLLNKKKVKHKRGLIVTTKAIIRKGLFEPIVEIIKEKVLLDELSYAEREQWAFQHRSLIAEGLMRKNNEKIRDSKIIPISTSTIKKKDK